MRDHAQASLAINTWLHGDALGSVVSVSRLASPGSYVLTAGAAHATLLFFFFAPNSLPDMMLCYANHLRQVGRHLGR